MAPLAGIASHQWGVRLKRAQPTGFHYQTPYHYCHSSGEVGEDQGKCPCHALAGTRCPVPGARDQARCPVPGARCPVPGG